MAMRDMIEDLAKLVCYIPSDRELEGQGVDPSVFSEIQESREEERQDYIESARSRWEDDPEYDLLLAEIRAARERMLADERRLRELVAYGREFVKPRPYRLEDLARAAGMSISGVRTAYDDDEVETVAAAIGAQLPADRAKRRRPR